MRRSVVLGFLSCLSASCASAGNTETSTGTDPVDVEPDSGASDDSSDDDSTRDAGHDSGAASRPSSKPTVPADAGPNLCEKRTIHAQSVSPDVLIVLDKSLSMLIEGRWDPSRMAVEMLVSQFGTEVAFGLSMFPAGDLGVCDPGQLDVPVDLNNAAPISQQIDSALPIGITPTAQTLENALNILGDRNASPDSPPGPPTYVLLVTDGEPNCPDLMHLDPLQSSIDAVQALQQANIETFVVGYELAGLDAMFMDQLAQAGGTDHYYAVENQADLSDAFQKITSAIISCTFELTEAPPDPTYVRIEIDGNTLELNSADGWVINGKTITLQGTACSSLRDGKEHQLDSEVECMPVIAL